MPATKREIRLTDSADRWRFTCPAGHRSWEPTNYHFWCQQCAQRPDDTDPEFHELRDTKTDELVGRDELELTEDDRMVVS